jgi:transcriptional regulator with XRE-family HTH domain
MRFLTRLLRKRIVEARAHSGLSATDLAQLVGVSLRTMHRWESGTRRPTMEDLCKLACYCDVTLLWLLHDVDLKREEIAREV